MELLLIFFSELLIPGIMLIFGGIMKKDAPEMNYLMGYRTKRSMLSRDTWEFAHELCGKIWLRVGAVMLAISIIIMLVTFFTGTFVKLSAIVIFSQVGVLLLTIIPVEVALKNTFDDNGERK